MPRSVSFPYISAAQSSTSLGLLAWLGTAVPFEQDVRYELGIAGKAAQKLSPGLSFNAVRSDAGTQPFNWLPAK